MEIMLAATVTLWMTLAVCCASIARAKGYPVFRTFLLALLAGVLFSDLFAGPLIVLVVLCLLPARATSEGAVDPVYTPEEARANRYVRDIAEAYRAAQPSRQSKIDSPF